MKIISVAIFGLITLNINSMTIRKLTSGVATHSFISAEAPLVGTHWKLVELSNTKIPLEKTSGEAYLILKNDSTVTGNGGCNSFTGKYGLGKDHAIYFGEMVRTNIACNAIDLERRFINALAKIDHYNIKGDTLSLNQGQFKSLAKFVAAH